MKDKSRIGGVLTIVSGGIGVLVGIFVAVIALLVVNLFSAVGSMATDPMPDEFRVFFALIYGGMSLFYLLTGALAVIGGIIALQRRHWGWALTGAISGAVTFSAVGIAAVIFVIMAREEFAAPFQPQATMTPPPAPHNPTG